MYICRASQHSLELQDRKKIPCNKSHCIRLAWQFATRLEWKLAGLTCMMLCDFLPFCQIHQTLSPGLTVTTLGSNPESVTCTVTFWRWMYHVSMNAANSSERGCQQLWKQMQKQNTCMFIHCMYGSCLHWLSKEGQLEQSRSRHNRHPWHPTMNTGIWCHINLNPSISKGVALTLDRSQFTLAYVPNTKGSTFNTQCCKESNSASKTFEKNNVPSTLLPPLVTTEHVERLSRPSSTL